MVLSTSNKADSTSADSFHDSNAVSTSMTPPSITSTSSGADNSSSRQISRNSVRAAGILLLSSDHAPTGKPVNYSLKSTVFSQEEQGVTSSKFRVIPQPNSQLFGDDRLPPERRVSRRKREDTAKKLFGIVVNEWKGVGGNDISASGDKTSVNSTHDHLFGTTTMVANKPRVYDVDTNKNLWGCPESISPREITVSTHEALFGTDAELPLKVARKAPERIEDTKNKLFGHMMSEKPPTPPAPPKPTYYTHDKIFGSQETPLTDSPPIDENGGSFGRLFGNPPEYPPEEDETPSTDQQRPAIISHPMRKPSPYSQNTIDTHDILFGKPTDKPIKEIPESEKSYARLFGNSTSAPINDMSSALPSQSAADNAPITTSTSAHSGRTTSPSESLSPRSRQRWSFPKMDSLTTLWKNINLNVATRHNAADFDTKMDHGDARKITKPSQRKTDQADKKKDAPGKITKKQNVDQIAKKSNSQGRAEKKSASPTAKKPNLIVKSVKKPSLVDQVAKQEAS